MTTNRREFMKGVAISAGAGIAAGCACAKGTCGGTAVAPMRNFSCAPMKNGIRVGIVGCGARGAGLPPNLGGAVGRLLKVPGVEVTAVCDVRPECTANALKVIAAVERAKPLVFSGTVESYKALCDPPVTARGPSTFPTSPAAPG